LFQRELGGRAKIFVTSQRRRSYFSTPEVMWLEQPIRLVKQTEAVSVMLEF